MLKVASLVFSLLFLLTVSSVFAGTSRLIWEAGGDRHEGFIIERQRQQIGVYAPIATIAKDVFTYVDITPGQQGHCYQVRAFNDNGESDPSNITCKQFAGSSLEDELLNDPLRRGYSTMTAEQVVKDGRIEYRTRNRRSMSGREVAAEVVASEYNALLETKKSQFLALIASDNLDPYGLAVTVIKDIFGAGSATVRNLANARVESIDRWVELGLRRIRQGDVRIARGEIP